MASPLPPVDIEQQNIIDKLAEFVARNGPEFEALTSEKQRDNPKFAFLRGGQFHEYYMFRVNEARKIWQQQYSTKNKSHQVGVILFDNFIPGFIWFVIHIRGQGGCFVCGRFVIFTKVSVIGSGLSIRFFAGAIFFGIVRH